MGCRYGVQLFLVVFGEFQGCLRLQDLVLVVDAIPNTAHLPAAFYQMAGSGADPIRPEQKH
jgi:hypothetical protein